MDAAHAVKWSKPTLGSRFCRELHKFQIRSSRQQIQNGQFISQCCRLTFLMSALRSLGASPGAAGYVWLWLTCLKASKGSPGGSVRSTQSNPFTPSLLPLEKELERGRRADCRVAVLLGLLPRRSPPPLDVAPKRKKAPPSKLNRKENSHVIKTCRTNRWLEFIVYVVSNSRTSPSSDQRELTWTGKGSCRRCRPIRSRCRRWRPPAKTSWTEQTPSRSGPASGTKRVLETVIPRGPPTAPGQGCGGATVHMKDSALAMRC